MKRLIQSIALALLSLPAAAQVVTASMTASTRYNDQYLGANGQANTGGYTTGDTRFSTQLSNGTIVATINDGVGGSHVTSGRNTMVQTITNGFLTETSLNTFDDYGIEGCTYNGTAGQTTCTDNSGSWTDGYTWKTTGIWARGSNLYKTVYRELDSSPYTGINSSILMSQDNGLIWCNYTHVVSQACSGESSISGETADVPTSGQSMWTATTMRGPVEVWYCQAQTTSCPSVDSNSTYAYLTTTSSTDTDLYLLRIPVGEVADLNVSEYQYWTGSTWSSTVASASPIITASFGDSPEVFYDSTLQQYILLQVVGAGNYTGVVVWSAPSITGPWANGTIIPATDQMLGFFHVATSTKVVLANGCTQYTVTSDGAYSYQSSVSPLVNNYSTQLNTIQFCLAPSGFTSFPRTASHYQSEGIVQNGLYQEYDMRPVVNGNATTYPDSSGQGNTGTAENVHGVYSAQGDAGFANSHYISTGSSYSGTNFTLTLVFRHQWEANSFERLLGNTTTGTSQGSLLIQRNSATVDTWQADADDGFGGFTMSDNSWQEIIWVRNGTTCNLYDANSFNGPTVTPLESWSCGSHALSGTLITLAYAQGLGGFYGQIAYWNFYTTALSTQQLIKNQAVIVPRMARRGIVLVQPILSNQLALDTMQPLVAWSLRKVVSSWTGNAVNIKRASDSTSEDIGFDSSGNLNNTTLTSFCTGTTCTVNTYYDQSGHGYNATCTAGPTIYISGAPVTSGTNGHTAVTFNGSTQYCDTPSAFYYFGTFGSGEGVASLSSSAGDYSEFAGWYTLANTSNTGNSGGADPLTRDDLAESMTFYHFGQFATGQSITYGIASVMASMFGDYYWRNYTDGNAVVTTDNAQSYPPRFITNTVCMGSQKCTGTVSMFWDGQMSELFMFPYALSSESYANLRANQKTYYATP